MKEAPGKALGSKAPAGPGIAQRPSQWRRAQARVGVAGEQSNLIP